MRERRPFALPLKGDDWELLQWYGSTEEAYEHRYEWYCDTQGLHPGVDFGGNPATPVYAAGSGRVATIDGYRGNLPDLPHSLSIIHGPEYGVDEETGLVFRTLYGHLIDRPLVVEGELVEEGQLIAYMGFMPENAADQQHMHFEVRVGDDRRVNPVPLVTAPWDEFPRDAQRAAKGAIFHSRGDGKWRTPYDQPDVLYNGPMIYRQL